MKKNLTKSQLIEQKIESTNSSDSNQLTLLKYKLKEVQDLKLRLIKLDNTLFDLEAELNKKVKNFSSKKTNDTKKDDNVSFVIKKLFQKEYFRLLVEKNLGIPELKKQAQSVYNKLSKFAGKLDYSPKSDTIKTHINNLLNNKHEKKIQEMKARKEELSKKYEREIALSEVNGWEDNGIG